MKGNVMILQLSNSARPLTMPSTKDDYFSSPYRKILLLGITAVDWVFDAIERRQERLELSRFSDRELKDIGLARHEVDGLFETRSRV